MKFALWINGFSLSSLITFATLFCCGLWFHNKDFIVPGLLFGIGSLVFFVLSFDESQR